MSHHLRTGTAAAGGVLTLLALAACTPVSSSDPTPHSAAGAGAGPAPAAVLTQLDQLPVKGRAPHTGYARSQFGPAWSDDNTALDGHNGCDTRDDILARDLVHVQREGRCTVLSGELHDPYTGKTISFTRGIKTSLKVQIDHIVPLSLAWQTGAQQLTAAQRLDLANDPDNLVAVDGPTNEAKGDSDAAGWLPPSKAIRCGYAIRQVEVKAKYRLWVSPPEKDALRQALGTCPGPSLPGQEAAK